MMRREIASGINYCIFEGCLVQKGNEEETQHSLLIIRTKLLFQTMYYHVTKVRNNTHAMYEHWRRRELIKSFSWQSAYIKCKAIKELRKVLAKYTVFLSSKSHVPLPNHLDKNCFTVAAMDNCGNADKNSLSGRMYAHDTAKTLFQVQPDNHIQKYPKYSLDLTNALNLNKLLFQGILLLPFFSKASTQWLISSPKWVLFGLNI